MNKLCDECEQKSEQKFVEKSAGRIFAIRPKNFSGSLKEIENQPKTFEKFWLGIIWLVPLHSHKNGWFNQAMRGKAESSLKVGKQQHVEVLGASRGQQRKVSQAK